MHTIKKNAEAVEVTSKETGLEVNGDKTKYIAISRDQNARRSHNIKIDIVPLKGWNRSNISEETNQNYIQEEIKSRLQWAMLAIFRSKIFCLPVCYPKM